MLKKLLTLLLPALLTLTFSVGLLSASILLLGGSDDLMLSLMRHYAPAAETALPDSEYPAVAEMITDYLLGRTDEFQHRYPLNGVEVLAFNQKEQQHMADVQGLFGIARIAMISCVCLALLLIALTAVIYDRQAVRKALLGAGIASLTAVVVIAIAAAVCFDELFVLFHKLAFTNDLWLLDPHTDLLIRLMPTSFFVTYAAYIGIAWAGLMALVIFLPLLLTKERNK